MMKGVTEPGAPSIYCYQVLIQPRTITASKFALSCSPTASSTWIDYNLQVNLQAGSIMASKCIPKGVQLQPQMFARSSSYKCISPNSVNHGLQLYLRTPSITPSKFAWPYPPSASPHSLDHDLGVHRLVHSITASKRISKYARLPPPSVSLTELNHGLGVYYWIHSIIIFRRTSNLLSSTAPAASPAIPCRWVAI